MLSCSNILLSLITISFGSFIDALIFLFGLIVSSSFSIFSLILFLIKVKSLDKLSNLYCLKLIILPFESKVNLFESKGFIYLLTLSDSSFFLFNLIALLFNFNSLSLFLISSSLSFLSI